MVKRASQRSENRYHHDNISLKSTSSNIINFPKTNLTIFPIPQKKGHNDQNYPFKKPKASKSTPNITNLEKFNQQIIDDSYWDIEIEELEFKKNSDKLIASPRIYHLYQNTKLAGDSHCTHECCDLL